MEKDLVGTLGEAFSISERGTVIIVELTGRTPVELGDTIKIQTLSTTVKGIESIRSNPRPKVPNIGLLVEGEKSLYQSLQGQNVYLEEKHDK